MSTWLALALSFGTLQPPQEPDPGIALQLAETRRSRLGQVEYSLRFELDPTSEFTTGTIRCRFDLPDEQHHEGELWMDFGGDALEAVKLNDRVLESPLRAADHFRLPAEHLRDGENVLEARFRSRVAATGTPLTRYDDSATGECWLYTLLVPADAHRLFPCFDQPDIKARFELTLQHPADWTVVANAEVRESRTLDEALRLTAFAQTAPLPTYLFAFAGGPFELVVDDVGSGAGDRPERPLRLLVRATKRAYADAPLLFEKHRSALRWLEDYFAIPYPFGKLDIVVLPGFPYGGMEHAGAIFYRESALVFERTPTDVEQHRRSTLIYHEVAHQWFGNLVTMVWFDDLWLKEGFATFVAYRVLEALEPDSRAWLRFLQRVKPAAYRVDATEGTTPIWQELANLDDAKSAYGPIVYNKAPAVLRELETRLGAEAFRSGVRLFLQQHAFANAKWTDLVSALTEASGLHGSRWSDRWILAAGMPRVTTEWETRDGKIASFAIVQHGRDNDTWPLALDVMLLAEDGSAYVTRVRADSARTDIPDFVGRAAPSAALLNPTDVAYGEFALDERSRGFLLDNLDLVGDSLARAVAVAGLWQAVRDAELDPQRFARTLLPMISVEDDPLTHATLLDMLGTCLGRYLAPARAVSLRGAAEAAFRDDLARGRAGLELQTLRFLAHHGRSDDTLQLLRNVLIGDTAPPGLILDDRDRFEVAAALLAAGQTDAIDLARRQVPEGKDVGKEMFIAAAASADPAVKARYFASYLQLGEPPEQWMQDSLQYFHWSGQSELTLPWLDNALESALWVKQHRRIFFMPAWLDAFVNAHASPDALAIVDRYLARHPDLQPDVRRKLLQSVDELRRTIRIRARFDSSDR